MLHTVLFEAWDCNDPEWETIIDVLNDNLPGFRVFYNSYYNSGHNMAFEWEDNDNED